MLPIPKELQNQKAIPFMEWCNNAIILYRETYGNDNEIDIFKIKRILDFYNQPFTPEMLEYFEGWRKDGEYTKLTGLDTFINNDEGTIEIHPTDKLIRINDNDYLLILKSLNDLITLCALAGVELTWKGEK